MKISTHALIERGDRLLHIAKTVGWGKEIVLRLEKPETQTVECLTDSGVLLIKSMDESVLVTAYLPTLKKATAIYYQANKKIPSFMVAKIRKNQKYQS